MSFDLTHTRNWIQSNGNVGIWTCVTSLTMLLSSVTEWQLMHASFVRKPGSFLSFVNLLSIVRPDIILFSFEDFNKTLLIILYSLA